MDNDPVTFLLHVHVRKDIINYYCQFFFKSWFLQNDLIFVRAMHQILEFSNKVLNIKSNIVFYSIKIIWSFQFGIKTTTSSELSLFN